ncbi:MAG: hypothetical protein WBX30_20080 [Stellaceae bacterium]
MGAPEHSSTYWHPLAVGNALDGVYGILTVHIDDLIRSEASAHLEPALTGSGQDHRLGTECLSDANTHQADRAWTGNDDPFAGNDAAHYVKPIHRGAGGDDQCRLVSAGAKIPH